MSVTVEALKSIGRYHPGDTFELSERDAVAFEALKIARRVQPERAVQGYETREFTVTGAKPVEAKLRRIKRREYKRRDLRAEE